MNGYFCSSRKRGNKIWPPQRHLCACADLGLAHFGNGRWHILRALSRNSHCRPLSLSRVSHEFTCLKIAEEVKKVFNLKLTVFINELLLRNNVTADDKDNK